MVEKAPTENEAWGRSSTRNRKQETEEGGREDHSGTCGIGEQSKKRETAIERLELKTTLRTKVTLRISQYTSLKGVEL